MAVPGAGPDAAGDESGVTKRPKRQPKIGTNVSGLSPFEALDGHGPKSRSRYKAAKAQEDHNGSHSRRASSSSLSHGEAKKRAKKARRAARAAAKHGTVAGDEEGMGGALDATLSGGGRRQRPMVKDLRSIKNGPTTQREGLSLNQERAHLRSTKKDRPWFLTDLRSIKNAGFRLRPREGEGEGEGEGGGEGEGEGEGESEGEGEGERGHLGTKEGRA